MFGNVIYKLYI